MDILNLALMHKLFMKDMSKNILRIVLLCVNNINLIFFYIRFI